MRARLWAALVRFLADKWQQLLLMIGLWSVLYAALGQARYIPDRDGALAALIFGSLLGLALVFSRFSARFCALYGALISAAFSAQRAGRILPPRSTLPQGTFGDWVNLLNLRALAFGEQIGAALGTLAQGGSPNPRLLLLLETWLAWGIGLWLVWWIFRRRQAWAALAPVLAVVLYGLVSAQQEAGLLITFSALAVLLAARTGFVDQTLEWTRRNIPFPWDFGFDWEGSVLVSAILIVSLSSAFTLVGTRRGWEKIDDFLDRFRTPAEAVPVPQELPDSFRESSLTADTSDLMLRFAPPPLQTAQVLMLRVSDPPPAPPEAGAPSESRTYYLRAEIYSTYTGSQWTLAEVESAGEAVQESTPPAGRRLLTQEVQMLARSWTGLFAVNQPFGGSPGLELLQTRADGSRLVLGAEPSYTVQSWATALDAAALQGAGTQYPPEIRAAYLQLPQELPPRVRSLAQQIARGASTPYTQALAIQDYLRQAYPYSLDVPPPPAGQDAADYFLFDVQEGFCSYSASAMAVMLRSLGVPARVVSGYAAHSYDWTAGAYPVLASNAHAWVEVYFPGYGWVEFEPTSAQPAPDYGILDDEAEQAQVVEYAVPVSRSVDTRRALLLAGLAGLLLAAAGVGEAHRSAARRPLTAARLYWEIRGCAVRLGRSASGSVTPDEFLAQCPPDAARQAWLDPLLREATRLYVLETYSPAAPDAAQMRALAVQWRAVRPARAAARLNSILHS